MRSGYRIQVLEGRDQVFGVAFRPGRFRPFLGAAVSTITDRVVPATEVFGPDLPTTLDVPTSGMRTPTCSRLLQDPEFGDLQCGLEAGLHTEVLQQVGQGAAQRPG